MILITDTERPTINSSTTRLLASPAHRENGVQKFALDVRLAMAVS
ncbi:hypothetical protein [Streptomyces microflavus]